MDNRGIAVRPAIVFMVIILVTIMLAGIINPHLHYFTNTMDNASDETDNPAPQSIFDNLNQAIVLYPIVLIALFVIAYLVKTLFFEAEYQTYSRILGGGELLY